MYVPLFLHIRIFFLNIIFIFLYLHTNVCRFIRNESVFWRAMNDTANNYFNVYRTFLSLSQLSYEIDQEISLSGWHFESELDSPGTEHVK